MNLIFRLFKLFIRALFFRTKELDFLASCSIDFRVWPTDLDLNMHMTNSRYLCFMDLGRMDLLAQTRTLLPLFKNGYFPVVASESIRFKRSLKPFEKFSVKTQITDLDEKDFYIKQTFYHQKKIVAEGFIRGRFKKKGVGSVSTKDLFAFVGKEYPELELSPLAKAEKLVGSELCKG